MARAIARALTPGSKTMRGYNVERDILRSPALRERLMRPATADVPLADLIEAGATTNHTKAFSRAKSATTVKEVIGAQDGLRGSRPPAYHLALSTLTRIKV